MTALPTAPPAPRKPMRGWAITAGLLLLFVLWCVLSMLTKKEIATTSYTIRTPKLAAPIRLVVIADLHNALYGQNQRQLLDAVDGQRPDLVLFVGDIFHLNEKEPHALRALSALGAAYPCYFVTGNHERRARNAAALIQAVESCGVTVLGGAWAMVNFNGQALQICGLANLPGGSGAMLRQLAQAGGPPDGERYSLLMCHCPEQFADMLPYGFDLMLSGHTHGGQWRAPFLQNGIYAPGQGWFPQYAGGRFDFDSQTLIVSRGLSKQPALLPRFGNPPELVMVELLPKG